MKLKTRITIERDGVEREVEVTGHYSPGERPIHYGPRMTEGAPHSIELEAGQGLTPNERERAIEALWFEWERVKDRDGVLFAAAAEARREG